MRTDAQIEASRLNGAKSKGPITEDGRIRSSQNATKHGMAGHKLMVIEGESLQEWSDTIDEHVRAFEPETRLEWQLVVEIAAASWRLRRSKFVETAMIDREIARQREELSTTCGMADDPLRHASAMLALGGNIGLLDRYETRAARAYERAVRNFDNLRARRRRNNTPDS